MIDMFNQIMQNIRRGKYKYIGAGSSRQVFDLGNGYVIKVATNSAGMAQNQCEYKISHYDKSDLLAKVVQASKNYKFLIMEKANKIYSMAEVCEYFNVHSKKELFTIEELKSIISDYDLLVSDLKRPNSWGMINGKPVIIDYGFTRDVCKKYYFYFGR